MQHLPLELLEQILLRAIDDDVKSFSRLSATCRTLQKLARSDRCTKHLACSDYFSDARFVYFYELQTSKEMNIDPEVGAAIKDVGILRGVLEEANSKSHHSLETSKAIIGTHHKMRKLGLHIYADEVESFPILGSITKLIAMFTIIRTWHRSERAVCRANTSDNRHWYLFEDLAKEHFSHFSTTFAQTMIRSHIRTALYRSLATVALPVAEYSWPSDEPSFKALLDDIMYCWNLDETWEWFMVMDDETRIAAAQAYPDTYTYVRGGPSKIWKRPSRNRNQ